MRRDLYLDPFGPSISGIFGKAIDFANRGRGLLPGRERRQAQTERTVVTEEPLKGRERREAQTERTVATEEPQTGRERREAQTERTVATE